MVSFAISPDDFLVEEVPPLNHDFDSPVGGLSLEGLEVAASLSAASPDIEDAAAVDPTSVFSELLSLLDPLTVASAPADAAAGADLVVAGTPSTVVINGGFPPPG